MDLDGADWAVEAGPIPSMKFREEAVAYLGASLDGFDRLKAEKLLKDERVRVAEGLDEKTADQLAARLGKRETLARAARGPTPSAGMAGALKHGLPFIGVGLAPILGLAVHPLGWLVGVAVAIGLAWKNTRTRMQVLGSAPVGAVGDPALDGSISSFVALKDKLDEGAHQQLGRVVRQSTDIIAWSADPEDLMALGTGGTQGLLAESAVKMIAKAVGIGEAAAKDGRTSFSGEESASLASLEDLGQRALNKAKGQGDEALELNDLEETVESGLEAIEEIAFELEV